MGRPQLQQGLHPSVDRRASFAILKIAAFSFVKITIHATVLSSPFSAQEPLMAKRSKNPRREEALAPLAEPIPRVATRRAMGDRKLRIRERLTSGLSVGHIARVEQLTVQRVRQIIAEMLEKPEVLSTCMFSAITDRPCRRGHSRRAYDDDGR
ncbi:MAG: hypothetical protein WAV18_26350 [Roseiarcus sp.]